MSSGFCLPCCNSGIAESDLGSATISMGHGDHALDVVQLNRDVQVVPESNMPRCKALMHRSDWTASDRELAVPIAHADARHV